MEVTIMELEIRKGKGFLSYEHCIVLLVAMKVTVENTLFNKRASHLVILESDPSKTRFNYYLVRRKQRKFLKDIKVLPSEDCITQHRPLIFGNVRKVKDTRKMFVPGRKI